MQSSPLKNDTTAANLVSEFNPVLEALINPKASRTATINMAKWRLLDPTNPNSIGGSNPLFMMKYLELGMKSRASNNTGFNEPITLANKMAIPWMVAGIYGFGGFFGGRGSNY